MKLIGKDLGWIAVVIVAAGWLTYAKLAWPDDLPPALVHLTFDETGTSVRNHGTQGGNFILKNTDGNNTDLHSDEAFVSGQLGDRCFDNTASTEMAGTGGRCEAESSALADGLKQITVTFWYKTEQFDGNGAFPIFKGDGSDGWNITFRYKDFVFHYNRHDTDKQTRNFPEVNQPVFVTVTYDGTTQPGTDNVFFYKGTKNIQPFVVSVQSLPPETIKPTEEKLTIGNEFGRNDSPFDVLMDNVRVYDRVLTPEEILRVWMDDLGNVPPPPIPTPSPTPIASPTPQPSPTPTHTATPTPIPSPTKPPPTPTPTATPTPTPTPTPGPEPTPKPSPEPTPPEQRCTEVSSLDVIINNIGIYVGEIATVLVTVKCQKGELLRDIPVSGKIKKGNRKKVVFLNDSGDKSSERIVFTNEEGVACFFIEGIKKGKARVRFYVNKEPLAEEQDYKIPSLKVILKIRVRK